MALGLEHLLVVGGLHGGALKLEERPNKLGVHCSWSVYSLKYLWLNKYKQGPFNKKKIISNVADLSVTHISSLLLHGRGKIMQVEMSG
jgi:hypothetical protein